MSIIFLLTFSQQLINNRDSHSQII